MADGLGNQSPNYFGALAELAREVGKVEAQVGERVTYKELMAQNTQQRGELTAKIDKMEEHLSENMRSSVDGIGTRLDALVQRMELYAQQQAAAVSAVNQTRGGGNGKVAVGSIATIAGSAIGVGVYMILRSFGVAP